MARTSKAAVAAEPTELDTPAAAQALTTLQQEGGALIASQANALGETEYNRVAALARVRGLMGQASLIMYELGKALIWIRANEPEAEFIGCLGELGMERRMANRFMQAARKFDGALNNEQRERLLGLNRSKLLELVALDDDALVDVVEGNGDGLDLDEIDAMSVSELRAAIRKERELRAAEGEAKQKRLDDRNRRIDQLENELEKVQHGTKDEKARARHEAERRALEQLQAATLALFTQIESFDVAVGDILAKAEEDTADTATLRGHASDTLSFAFRKIADISVEREMPVDFSEIANPAWLRSMQGKAD